MPVGAGVERVAAVVAVDEVDAPGDRPELVDDVAEVVPPGVGVARVEAEPDGVAALGPAGMRSDWLMTLALRWMGNLVDEADRDRAARVWRWAGRRSIARDARPPFA